MSRPKQDSHSFISHRGQPIYRDSFNDRWYTYFGATRIEHIDIEALKLHIDDILFNRR